MPALCLLLRDSLSDIQQTRLSLNITIELFFLLLASN